MEEARTPRRVFVLGRDPVLDVAVAAHGVAAENKELVLISVGPRVSPTQRAILDEALRLASTLRVPLDEVWAARPESATGHVEDDDDVTVVASGREQRRLERALGLPSTQRRLRTAQADRGEPGPGPPLSGTARTSRPDEGDGSRAVAQRVAIDTQEMAPDGPEPQVASESVEALAGRDVPQPVLETAWTKEQAQAQKRAALRIYLGMAPGVGKTYAMLDEGQRRKGRGTDVVVGIVQTYGRPKTREKLEGLDVVPPCELDYWGRKFEEMDAAAIIQRRPDVVLVDELAHTNIPGSRRAKRWEDVLDILAEGIVVITTLNIQHVASLNDVMAGITGIRQQETIPDWVLDLADQVELVDMSPYALQRRMIHGNVYPDPRKAELALRRFFTTENLTGLRELALMRVANQVDEDLLRRWSKAKSLETRERILVCVSGSGDPEQLVRRGARMAQRSRGDLVVLHVLTGEGEPSPQWTTRMSRFVEELGGEFQILEAEDPVEGALSFAYRQHVTQIVVGESLRSRWRELLRGSFVNRLIRRASNVDVHVIARSER
jgi:nucleotide-binding universal stress UspA family protein